MARFIAFLFLAVQVLGKGLAGLPRDQIIVATKVSIAATASKATASHSP
jgi:aryl-alcohol dehydrogenase-like predicted oxidoreductase